jgi:hypothetical protein
MAAERGSKSTKPGLVGRVMGGTKTKQQQREDSLAAGRWLLAAGCRLPAAGSRPLVAGS